MACAVELSPSQPFLAVRGVPGRALADEATQVLDEAVGRRETAHTEREQHPAASVRGLGWILSELLTNLAVDLVPR